MIVYNTPKNIIAFSTGRDEKPTNEPEDIVFIPFSPSDTEVALGSEGDAWLLQEGGCGKGDSFPLALPRQTHTAHVIYADKAWREPETDAVWTDKRGLALAVKTADCIPVLLWDEQNGLIAAVHAGWKGTVQYIVHNTIAEMYGMSTPDALHAIIGPGISLNSFEVGDEVCQKFLDAGFPMERIARKYEKWHIDLFEANRWVLEACGVFPENIHVDGTDTMITQTFYSARRETINTGRNYNCIVMK